ncbi:MAG: hypothetical protein OHK0022_60080 [Roseiflexaceae bacterium]
MSTDVSPSSIKSEQPKVVVSEQLHCALTGKPVRADEAYWAPPLITAGELIGTLVRTAIRTPGLLGQVLLAEQPNVPYAKEAREQLAARRSTEQLKLLLVVLTLVAVVVVPILLLAFR